jgi:arginase
MDLALATGRGEDLLTRWPDIEPPLVPDAQVVQIGERNSRDPDFEWSDINDTEIDSIDVFAAREMGAEGVLRRTFATLDRADWPFWIHLDVDVLDQELMPAVDSPGSPGLPPDAIATVLHSLSADRRAAGITLTIFDPDLDPDGRHAGTIIGLMAAALAL